MVPKAETSTGKLWGQQRKEQAIHLFITLKKAYSENDFRELCFLFGIDYDSMSGETKPLKMQAFVNHYYTRNQLGVLTNFLEGDRPEWNWRPEARE